MFMGQDEEAKAIYLAHKGEPVPEGDNSLWEQFIAEEAPESGLDAPDDGRHREIRGTSPRRA